MAKSTRLTISTTQAQFFLQARKIATHLREDWHEVGQFSAHAAIPDELDRAIAEAETIHREHAELRTFDTPEKETHRRLVQQAKEYYREMRSAFVTVKPEAVHYRQVLNDFPVSPKIVKLREGIQIFISLMKSNNVLPPFYGDAYCQSAMEVCEALSKSIAEYTVAMQRQGILREKRDDAMRELRDLLTVAKTTARFAYRKQPLKKVRYK